jgi:hypothetical protein
MGTIIMTHANTPAIKAFDPRGLAARIHPGAVVFGAVLGLIVGIQPAIWNANDGAEILERSNSTKLPSIESVRRRGQLRGKPHRKYSEATVQTSLGAASMYGNGCRPSVGQRLPIPY